MSKRKFYRTVIQVEVISETPIGEMDMSTIIHEMNYGDLSGKCDTQIQDEEVDGKRAAEILMDQGSDTEFFQLDENGNDIDEDEGVFFAQDAIDKFKADWGQTHDEICTELGYDPEDEGSGEEIRNIGNYFWHEKDQKWYNKTASTMTTEEEEIAEWIQQNEC